MLRATRRFRTRCVDVVAVKGKTIGVSVYEIMSRKTDTECAEIHDKIVDTCEQACTAPHSLSTLHFWQVSFSRMGDKYTRCLSRYGAGFQCYKNRQFEEATTHLQALLVRSYCFTTS